VHDKIKDKKCPLCDYAGSRSHLLKNHMIKLHATN
jgi:hypothetical protein